jgi:DNA-binding PadR family transcriptional regulator
MPDPRDFLPLKPLDLQLLLALTEEERHGYGLVQAVSDRTDGLITLEPGNLYRVVKRLLDDGLVAESARRDAPDVGDGDDQKQRRRYYRITALGSRVVAAELQRLGQLVRSQAARDLVQRWAT